MADSKAAGSISIGSPASDTGPSLRIHVIYTGTAGTNRALETAANLARDLDLSITLILAQVVPWPLELEKSPVSREFTEELISQLAGRQEALVRANVYLCRDRDEAIRRALQPDSLVLIGTQSRWWPFRERRLARLLRHDGHTVFMADGGPNRTVEINANRRAESLKKLHS